MGPTLINSDNNHKIMNEREHLAMADLKSNGSNTSMAANMYRVGDYVYFENSSNLPYQIRRIEELIKSPNGNVEAKVMCFYRRKDIGSSCLALAEKHQSALEEEQEREAERLDDKEQHQLKHRELFLSRQMETLPATHIRGKCTVTLLNETESLISYLNKDDTFFYSLVFDPSQKTLLADRGEIRIGQKYQAEIPPLLEENVEDDRKLEDLETIVYNPENRLTDLQIDNFLILCRSVGTFARALDCSSSVKQPSLHMSAAAASRDITLFHAMDILHRHKYDIANAVSSLVPSGGPLLCRDEMEEWSASEANLFEEALEKYGKDFNDIRQDFLPWKSLNTLVEYYYMWKTTDRYVQQKRVKAVEAESKLKQVYIPASKPGAINGDAPSPNNRPCESCSSTVSSQWFVWGVAHTQCRLCQPCWTYWKKYGGLKYPSHLECLDLASEKSQRTSHRCSINGCSKEFKVKAQLARHCATAHGIFISCSSPRPIVKTRAAFFLCTTASTRLARRLCSHIANSRRAARGPFLPINVAAIRQECETVHNLPLGAGPLPEGFKPVKPIPKDRGKVVDVSQRLGTPNMPKPQWLILTPRDQLPQPERVFFPPPPRGPDGQYVFPLPQNNASENSSTMTINNVSHSIINRKRLNDSQHNGLDGAPFPKRRLLAKTSELFATGTTTTVNGRAKVATMARVGGRKQVISWVDAPDDVYFVATEFSKRARRQVPITEIKKTARQPCRKPLSGSDLTTPQPSTIV